MAVPGKPNKAGSTARNVYIARFAIHPVRLRVLAGLSVLSLTMAAAPKAEALTVCSAIWTTPDAPQGGTKTASIQGANSACPTAAIGTTAPVGSGANAGVVVTSGAGWAVDANANLFPTTSDSGVVIGSPAATTSAAVQNLSVTFDRTVSNPYFYTSFFNTGESLTFTAPFTVLQSNFASTTGNTITGTNSNGNLRSAGFVAQLLGDYSQIDFQYSNTNTFASSFVFTTGVNVTATPGPLPILGLGAALSQCRKLRRLSHQRRGVAEKQS
jgi:hypothetical protein